MKKLLLGSTALLAVVSVGPALAADLPIRTKAPMLEPVSVYNWPASISEARLVL